MRIKIFYNLIFENLENEINEWIKDNNGQIKIHDIKYSAGSTKSAMVIYEYMEYWIHDQE